MAFLYFRWVSDFFEVLRVQNPYAAASVQLIKAMKPQAGQVDSALISALTPASALPNFAQNNPQAAIQGQRTSPLKGMRPLQRYII
jgi:hypothetical protein